MFDFDAGKLIVFGIVALAVIPPKDLPRVLRTVGKYMGQMRRMASDFRGQFESAIREAEFESIKKEINEINEAAKIDESFDPAGLMRENLEKAVEDKPAPSTYETAAEPSAPSAYETVTVEPPAPPPEPVPVEAPRPEKRAASGAT